MKQMLQKFIALILLIASPLARGQFFNSQMSYQGYLKNGATPLNDLAGFPMMFIIRKNNVAIWCQTTSGGNDIPVVNGIFTTLLTGASNCLSLTKVFDQTLFIAGANSDLFTIDTTVDVLKNGFGTPDDATFAGVLLVPVPLALAANTSNTAVNFTGSLSGDVTGTQGASVLSKLQGNAIAAGSPSNGQVLEFVGGTWAPVPLPTPPVVSVAGRTGAVALTTADISGLGTAAGLSSASILQTTNSLSELTMSAGSARGNIGAAPKGTNADITSLTGLTTALPVTEGGTGASTASAARTALAVAASGANNDITSMGGLTTPLSIAQGGTAAGSFSGNSVVITNNTGSALTNLACSSGQVIGFNVMGIVQCANPTTGTITSLGLSLPGIFSVSGSPVTSSGTITASLVVESANLVFAGPPTAPAVAPSFRALVAADIPGLPASQITSGQLSISNGGTGAATAAAARAALSAAGNGANGDITSLTGLTTALPVAEGGTGGATAAAARAALSAAGNGANGDITSLTGLTTALPIAEGGTGAATAAAARAALSAAASGANGDITSLTAVTSVVSSGALTVAPASGSAGTFGSNGGASATTLRSGTGVVTMTGAGTTAAAVTLSATGAGGGITLSPNTGGVTVNSSTTQKMKVGTAGTGFSAMGTCSFTSAMTSVESTATCTGVPASTSVVVHCSPNAALSAATGVVIRANGTLSTVAFTSTTAILSATWNCFWWQP